VGKATGTVNCSTPGRLGRTAFTAVARKRKNECVGYIVYASAQPSSSRTQDTTEARGQPEKNRLKGKPRSHAYRGLETHFVESQFVSNFLDLSSWLVKSGGSIADGGDRSRHVFMFI
jgi:hypothetical protein